jgi:hypothetical protein
MGIASGPNIVFDGLVLCLDAANTRSYPGSGNTWTDLSSMGYSMTLDGTSYNTSENTPYLEFTSDHGRIIYASGSGLWLITDTFTIHGFFRDKSDSGSWCFIWGFNDNNDINLFHETTTRVFHNNGPSIEDNVDLYNKGWVFYSLVCNAGSATMYRKFSTDSGLTVGNAGTVNLSGQWAINAGDFQIGATNEVSKSYAHPALDVSNVLVYNRALSVAEVRQNYDAHRTRFGL